MCDNDLYTHIEIQRLPWTSEKINLKKGISKWYSYYAYSSTTIKK